jgi:hypothetical protein
MQIGGASMKLADHPTVRAYKEGKIDPPKPPAILGSEQLREMALATRKIKIKGSPKLMMAFAKCFPS